MAHGPCQTVFQIVGATFRVTVFPKSSTRKPSGVQPELWHRLDTWFRCSLALLWGKASPFHIPAPVAYSVILSPFFLCLWHMRRLQPRACRTERSRQQAVFLRTNLSVLYLAYEWQLGALARCTGTLCLIRLSLLPPIIKIGWETLLGLESAHPLWLLHPFVFLIVSESFLLVLTETEVWVITVPTRDHDRGASPDQCCIT